MQSLLFWPCAGRDCRSPPPQLFIKAIKYGPAFAVPVGVFTPRPNLLGLLEFLVLVGLVAKNQRPASH